MVHTTCIHPLLQNTSQAICYPSPKSYKYQCHVVSLNYIIGVAGAQPSQDSRIQIGNTPSALFYHCMLFWSVLMAAITPTIMLGKKWTITLLLGKNSLTGTYGFSYLVHTNLKSKVCLQCKQGDNLAKGYKTRVLTIKMWLSILSLCYISGTWGMLYQLNKKQSLERDQKIAWEKN